MRVRLRHLTAAACCTTAALASAAPANAAPEDMMYKDPAKAGYTVTPYVPGTAPADAVRYVEYARSRGGGTSEDHRPFGFDAALRSLNLTYKNNISNPLRGEMRIDLAKMPTVATAASAPPAILLLHGGFVEGGGTPSDACTAARRANMRDWADKLAGLGYIVFNADFRRSNDDVAKTALANFPGIGLGNGTGDCMPDKGTDDGGTDPAQAYAMRESQYSAQLAVRSLKWQLRDFAAKNPGFAKKLNFEGAATKVVALGVSAGGHLAARLATRSGDGTAGGSSASRRVSGAVGISSLGDCTPNNPARDVSRWNGVQIFGMETGAIKQPEKPSAKCYVVPSAEDAPIRLYNGYRMSKDVLGRWTRFASPYAGGGPNAVKGSNGLPISWSGSPTTDGILDSRAPTAFCADMTAAAIQPQLSCVSRQYPIRSNAHFTNLGDTSVHQRFPFGTIDNTTGVDSGPQVLADIDGFLKNQTLVKSIPW